MAIFCSECNNVVTETYKEWMDHILCDDHQKNIAEKVWTWPEEINQRSVVITQKPNEQGDVGNLNTSFFTIIWYFTKYGNISNAFKHPSKKFCIIQFEKIESVQTFLTTESVVFEGVHVVLRLKSSLSPADWFTLCSVSASESELQESALGSSFHNKHIWLTEQIQDVDADVQLDKLLKLLTMSEYDFKKREQVRCELVSVVKEQYPNAKLIGIGDVITGLGDSDSVLTLSFELPGASYMDSLMENVNRLMISSVAYFKDVTFVKGYPAPYINATHCTTDVKLQLWFNDSIRVHSSKLMQFLISLDPRVLPLMILIRYWASYNFQPPNLMDTYTLDLLVMVYLNCMKILPNVAFLQLKSTVKSPLLDDFWNVSFCSDHADISEILASSRQWDVEYSADGKPTAGSVLFLAKHFFRMYAKVNFRITFVCSLLGSFFLKRHLDVECTNVTLPELLQPYTNWSLQQKKEERFKLDSAMCVQDPFNLGLNTAADVTEVAVLTFQNACYNSVDIFEKMLEDPSDSGSIINVTNVIDFVVPREENVDYQRNVAETGRVILRQSVLAPATTTASPIVSTQNEIQNYSNIIPGSDGFNVNPLAPLVVTIGNHGDVDYRTHFNVQNNLQPLMDVNTNTAEYFAPQNNDLRFNMSYNMSTNVMPVPQHTIQDGDVSNSVNITGIPHTSPSGYGFMTNNWVGPASVTSHPPGTANDRWFQEWPSINETYNASTMSTNADNMSSGMTVSVTRTVTANNNKQNKPGSKKKTRVTPIRKVKVTRTISLPQKSPQGNRNRGKKVSQRGRAAYKNSKNSRFGSSNMK